ncbi:MAG: hypothetical protein GX594_12255, partial [Pirellulaceae bacterium]|nr:hypothetical protein [Pirellulaceae bacterium]
MNSARPAYRENSDLHELISLAWNGALTPSERDRLEKLLLDDEAAQELYVTCMAMHGRLLWEYRGATAQVKQLAVENGVAADFADLGPGAEHAPDARGIDAASGALAPCAPAKLPRTSLAGAWQASADLFYVGGPVFSYMVASVFMCLLLLGFWAYKLPSDRGSSIASNENSRGLTDPEESSNDRPAPVFVGRVTGIAGAKWSDAPDYIAPIGVRVALGRTYKLKSGLMEITYDSGAKVILEGPCSYE